MLKKHSTKILILVTLVGLASKGIEPQDHNFFFTLSPASFDLQFLYGTFDCNRLK